MTNRNHEITQAAARRGWTYSPGKSGEFTDRWRWNPREPGLHTRGGYSHPFHGAGLTRYDQASQVVSGSTDRGRPFWAFVYSYQLGERSSIPRTIAFVNVGRRLPTVSIVPRTTTETPTGWLAERAARAVRKRDPQGADELAAHLDGVKVGTDDFQHQFLIEAVDQHAAEWLLTSEVERRLLVERTMSLAAKDADLLCWCDRGELDLDTVGSMLEVLDSVLLD